MAGTATESARRERLLLARSSSERTAGHNRRDSSKGAVNRAGRASPIGAAAITHSGSRPREVGHVGYGHAMLRPWWWLVIVVVGLTLLGTAGATASEPRSTDTAVLAGPQGGHALATPASPLRRPRLRERNGLFAASQRRLGSPTSVAVSGVCVHRRARRFGAVYLRDANGNLEGQVFRRVRGRWRYITGGSNWSGGPVLTAFLRHSGAACARRVVTIGANRCGTVVVEPNTEHAFVAVRASGIDCDAARARLLAWAQSGYQGQPEGLACSTLATVALAGTALRRCTGRRVAVEYIG
jgi:hypothetical protein